MDEYKSFTTLSRRNVLRKANKDNTKSPRLSLTRDESVIKQNGQSIAFTVDYKEPPSPIRRMGIQRLHDAHDQLTMNRASLQRSELVDNLGLKLEMATLRRQAQLAQLVGRLRKKSALFKRRQQVLEHSQRLEQIRLKALSDLEYDLAQMRRNMIIERMVQKVQLKHQKISQVALEYKLKKSMNLKKSYSVGMLDELVQLEEVNITKSKSTNNLQDLQSLTDLKAVFGDSIMPPITKKSLQELNLSSISANAVLRHDMLFDPSIELRPNEEGEKGRKKKAKADKFWNMLSDEVYRDQEPNYEKIPVLINEAKLIMLEMVANHDYKVSLEHHLDVFLLHQQLQKGVFDPISLIKYLADVFKAHCAPQRDLLIEVMVRQCQEGQFLNSLRLVFEVLEKMRLDVANDQIRTLKPVYIENAVQFEWNLFSDALTQGKQSIEKTVQWLQPYKSQGTPQQAFQLAYIDLISNFVSEVDALETFHLDYTRLLKMHHDWQDCTIVSCILMLFRQAAGPRYNVHHGKEMKKNLWSLLNEVDTTIPHISTQVCHISGQIRGKELTLGEINSMNSLIDKSLTQGSKIYDILYKRIHEALMGVLQTSGDPDIDFLTKNGLLEVQDELLALGQDMLKLYNHNRQVYKLIYDQVLLS